MREDIPDESVDLIYLDPPFNSKRLYNAFIGDAQWVAFDDTWRWSEAVDDFHEVASDVSMADTMEGLRKIHGEGSALAYLSYMANRLQECWRVLKPTGSIYLHCDPTMSHSLKLVLDAKFKKQNFRNELVWSYRTGGVSKRYWPRKHDILLFYVKSNKYQHNPIQERIYYDKPFFNENKDEKGRYYADVYVRDVWDDLKPVINVSKERLGYPTQKPLTLLERIVKASSNEGDTVLDPFCGCGTTIAAAQHLGRNWIGVDICVNACKVIEKRISESFDIIWSDVEFIGLPRTLGHAKTLASMDHFRFEKWAASLVDGMEANKKQVADKGIDGRGRLAIEKGKFIDIVSQIKAGHTNPGHIQAFDSARQQAGADLGIFTCFEGKVTQGMKDTAASAGKFLDVPRVQIYTIEDYFEGRKPDMPIKYRAA